MSCKESSLPSPLQVELTSVRCAKEFRRGNFSKLSEDDVAAFEEILGPDGMCREEELLEKHNIDYYHLFKGESKLMLLPKTTAQLSLILKHCNRRGLAVTPQGGKTGLVGGGVPVFDEIIVYMTRMKELLSFDQVTGIMVTESGATLRSLNDYAIERGFIVPLDLASADDCQIGGNVATNAGGLRLFRYGSLHSTVLGLEVVMANGDILDLLRVMKKDNTGYDLKQILIGSEGTLGVITKVAIQCPYKPASAASLLIGLRSFEGVMRAFQRAKALFQEKLSCCEVMDKDAMACVVQNLCLENPVANVDADYFLLLEYSCNKTEDETMGEILENYVSLLDDVTSSCIAVDADAISNVWNLRRGIGDAILIDGHTWKYDFSIPLEKFDIFGKDVKGRLGTLVKRCCYFGHLGDSNIHLVVTAESFASTITDLLEPYVYKWVGSVGGSISAEHGIGVKERKYIRHSKSEEAMDLMRKIKAVFDPRGILNPYKIFHE